MKHKPVLELEDLRRIDTTSSGHAQSRQWAVTVAIVDDGGHLSRLERLHGAAPISAHIAVSKARTAALGRRESGVYEDMIKQGWTAFVGAPGFDGMLEGGAPILVDGQCVGAVGAIGVKASEDAQVASGSIAAL